MKKILSTILLATLIFVLPFGLRAQSPPHPNTGNAPSGANTAVGSQQSSAPVGSGNYVLLVLALAYAGRKMHKRETEDSVIR
jgi:hypothetical protein